MGKEKPKLNHLADAEQKESSIPEREKGNSSRKVTRKETDVLRALLMKINRKSASYSERNWNSPSDLKTL